jgi:hypothetical protein
VNTHPPLPPITLDASCQPALLGHVMIDGQVRLAYSVSRLLRMERCSPARAREIVSGRIDALAADHGSAGPVFVDDTML